MKAYKSERYLRSMYLTQSLSAQTIADKLGCCERTILYWIDKHDIETRPDHRHIKGTHSLNGRGYAISQYNGEKLYMHRLLAVAKYGFDEVRDKVVHHKNRIKWDNRYENIEVMTNEEHGKLHGAGR